ncbi:DUF3499 family protein [Agromyces archimandritae]|uniref:DUF3499 domain-containing protein n=1 Tax=Agromyces archimandritae TaxID=2781962 RepID=A0A975IP38_9MICO|nr:DUF3499 family protein [Agromyces archimandritae]QTX05242.1 DUF3499 domain-containing protein [Agromyces archimandritae]
MSIILNGAAVDSLGRAMIRACSRTACSVEAVATLTFVYADSMAVLGPLALRPEPHSYDLCAKHAERTSPPKGWQLVRHSLYGEVGFTA